MQATRRLAVALFALAVTGCVAIETEPPSEGNECLLAEVSGVVAVDPEVGVGLRDDEGKIHRTLWPYGFTSYRILGGVTIVDDKGRVVAGEGDEIATAGFTDDFGVRHPCGPIKIVHRAGT
jgi:hypothetical protein